MGADPHRPAPRDQSRRVHRGRCRRGARSQLPWPSRAQRVPSPGEGNRHQPRGREGRSAPTRRPDQRHRDPSRSALRPLTPIATPGDRIRRVPASRALPRRAAQHHPLRPDGSRPRRPPHAPAHRQPARQAASHAAHQHRADLGPDTRPRTARPRPSRARRLPRGSDSPQAESPPRTKRSIISSRSPTATPSAPSTSRSTSGRPSPRARRSTSRQSKAHSKRSCPTAATTPTSRRSSTRCSPATTPTSTTPRPCSCSPGAPPPAARRTLTTTACPTTEQPHAHWSACAIAATSPAPTGLGESSIHYSPHGFKPRTP